MKIHGLRIEINNFVPRLFIERKRYEIEREFIVLFKIDEYEHLFALALDLHTEKKMEDVTAQDFDPHEIRILIEKPWQGRDLDEVGLEHLHNETEEIIEKILELEEFKAVLHNNIPDFTFCKRCGLKPDENKGLLLNEFNNCQNCSKYFND